MSENIKDWMARNGLSLGHGEAGWLISMKAVTVNGEVATRDTSVDEGDVVLVNGRRR